MASSRANHPPPPVFRRIAKYSQGSFSTSFFPLSLSLCLRHDSPLISRRHYDEILPKIHPPIPSYYFSKKGFMCIYIYIYTRLYLYIDGERGCVRVHKRKSSRAISAITSASAQTLPFFRRHWRSSLCRSLVSSSVSDIFFPPFFLLLLLSSFFFLYHPHFYSSFQQRRSNCAAWRQFSLRLIR